ncbi:hypothetical protein SAMD00019534_064400, partial [Acytostelium subglobosum LB1]|uniref:hypothetical protein n=1 Tax=Acytostelium subglobosum LB1 TaxID=1410327 RepID=UPI000644FB9D
WRYLYIHTEPILGLIKSDYLSDYDTQLEIQRSDPNSPLYSVKTFEELQLKPEILQGVYSMGFNKPSKIQEASLPVIINQRQNLVAQSQSGTGKTAAFTLGMLNTIEAGLQVPQVLCICPTLELAMQVHAVVCALAKHSNIQPFLAIKDVRLPKGPLTNQLIVGTTGKVEDLLKKRIIQAKFIRMLVLDEADHMVDTRGMYGQTKAIKSLLLPTVQVLLFSATFSIGVEKYIKEFVPEPYVSIRLKRDQLSVDKIRQFYVPCDSIQNKPLILCDLYSYISVGQSIVFAHTVKTAEALYHRMTQEGFSVTILTGRMESNNRFKEIDNFRQGKTKVLITTNVLARGIDILQVSLVINYDVPLDPKQTPDPVTYLHRVGRVGRFGRSGIAITFCDSDLDVRRVQAIAKHLERDIPELKRDDLESLDAMLRGLKDLTPLTSLSTSTLTSSPSTSLSQGTTTSQQSTSTTTSQSSIGTGEPPSTLYNR